MRQFLVLSLLAAALGGGLALIAWVGPFGNTGVDGTLGAGLALLGAVVTMLLVALLMARRLSHGWAVTVHVLALLVALLTAVAAVFLMQTVMALVMAACAVTLLVAAPGLRKEQAG